MDEIFGHHIGDYVDIVAAKSLEPPADQLSVLLRHVISFRLRLLPVCRTNGREAWGESPVSATSTQPSWSGSEALGLACQPSFRAGLLKNPKVIGGTKALVEVVQEIGEGPRKMTPRR
jgi:hypothetical protein